MKNFKLPLITLIIYTLFSFKNVPTEESEKIIGIWFTENNSSKIQIYKNDNQYFGKIIWLAPKSEKEDESPPVAKPTKRGHTNSHVGEIGAVKKPPLDIRGFQHHKPSAVLEHAQRLLNSKASITNLQPYKVYVGLCGLVPLCLHCPAFSCKKDKVACGVFDFWIRFGISERRGQTLLESSVGVGGSFVGP